MCILLKKIFFVGPLFDFEVTTIGDPQTFKDTLRKQRVQTKKKQIRDPRSGDNLGQEVTEAVGRVAARL